MPNFVVIGAPGSGKGTLCEQLTQLESITHVVASDLIKEYAYSDTVSKEIREEGQRAIEKGVLVSDSYITKLIDLKLKSLPNNQSVIFDGYPRTKGQADDLLSLTNIDYVINLNVPEHVIKKRLMNRHVCADCGSIWNVKTKPTTVHGVCDHCGGKTNQRKDDLDNEAVTVRLTSYYQKTANVAKHIVKKNGTLIDINITEETSPEDVYYQVMRSITAGEQA